ncbi:restriction endonuclease subunit S [Pseudonocardia asaccharolytica]|uniref:Type I restriction modification DNA specificity domain-containing protein n=1 Tax=Pseudonocardia asaccharolytica DSM 44247 = NBRC 16224 TaxID=1123024 RepID=A0A511D3W2_9PSEU|nr:restriction endonuclease subunit S [Pseudonocardia asaccharolytica]GEL19193.1 hypothetical protein PA7_30300 [Pseudonocardia asaccharolytica DSM 44247 = NBRC 16224]
MSAWPILPFDECVSDASAGNLKVPKSEYQESDTYAVIDQGKAAVAGYTDDPRFLYRGDLPVVIFGDHTRAFKYVDSLFCMGADGVKVLRPQPGINAKYLYHVLSWVDIPSAGYSHHFKFLKEENIVVPPLDEQRRIAQVLDSVDALRARRRVAISLLDELAQSTFLDIFGDPASNPKGWPVNPLRELGHVATGNTPSRDVKENYGDAIEWIKSDNIDPSRLYLTTASEFLSATGAKKARVVGPGSILVTCIAGSRARIGDAAVADRTVAFNQQINAISPSEQEWRFLYAQLRAAKRLVQERSTDGMTGLVSKARFESIELICPPLGLQKEFSARVSRVDMLEESHQRHLAELDALFASLQHRAFRGELWEAPAA